MRIYRTVALGLLLVGLVATSSAFQKNKGGDSGRLLTGRVVDRQDNSLVNAVVYLTNTRNQAVKTFIVSNDGMYRFPALSPNIDYEVYAQYNGKKSDTKTVSQFDNRQTVNINLRIDMK